MNTIKSKTAESRETPVAGLHGALIATDLAWHSVTIVGAAVVLIASDAWVPHALEGWRDWSIAIALVVAGILVFQFARLALIWRELAAALTVSAHRRTLVQKRDIDRGFVELFAYLLMSLTMLAATAFLSSSEGWLSVYDIRIVHSELGPANALHVAIFLLALVLSFAPLVTAFFLHGRWDAKDRELEFLREDVVSPLSLAIASAIVFAIGVLAWAAAGQMFSMTEDFGIFITIMVIFAFLAIIVAPHIARYLNNRSEAREAAMVGVHANALIPLIAPAKFVSKLDSGLVRLIAPLSGATQHGAGLPHALLEHRADKLNRYLR